MCRDVIAAPYCAGLAPDGATYCDWEHYVEYVAWHMFDVQALRNATTHERLLEHGQEGLGVLGQRKRAVGHDAGGVVEEGDEIGLAPPVPRDGDAGSVHNIAHPQLAGVDEGEATPVLSTGGVLGTRLVHEASAAQQPVHGGRRQQQRRGCDTALLHFADQLWN